MQKFMLFPFLIIFFFQYVSAQHIVKQPYKILPGHSNDVNAVAFSLPSMGVLVSGGWDNMINVYKADSTFQLITTLTGHHSAVKSVNFNNRVKIFATAGNDNLIIIWDSLNRRVRKLEDIIKGHNSKINTITFDKSGKYLISGDDEGKIIFWDVASGKVIRTFNNGTTVNNIVMFNQPQYFMVAGAEPTIKVNSLLNGQLHKSFTGHKDHVNSIAVTFNGKYLLSGSNDKTAKIWDLRTNKELFTLPVDCWKVTAVAFTLDGKYCATGCNNGSIKIWETESGKLITSITEQTYNVRDISFSPNGQFLAVAPLMRGNAEFGVRIFETKIPTASPKMHSKEKKDSIPTVNPIDSKTKSQKKPINN